MPEHKYIMRSPSELSEGLQAYFACIFHGNLKRLEQDDSFKDHEYGLTLEKRLSPSDVLALNARNITPVLLKSQIAEIDALEQAKKTFSQLTYTLLT